MQNYPADSYHEDTIYKHEMILLDCWKGCSYVNAHTQRVASCTELGIHNSQETYRDKIQHNNKVEVVFVQLGWNPHQNISVCSFQSR